MCPRLANEGKPAMAELRPFLRLSTAHWPRVPGDCRPPKKRTAHGDKKTDSCQVSDLLGAPNGESPFSTTEATKEHRGGARNWPTHLISFSAPICCQLQGSNAVRGGSLTPAAKSPVAARRVDAPSSFHTRRSAACRPSARRCWGNRGRLLRRRRREGWDHSKFARCRC